MVEIYRRLVEVYETPVLCWKQLWVGIKARRVLTSSAPDSEAHPQRMAAQIIWMAVSPENALITAGRRANFAESARQRDMSLGSVHSTVHSHPEQRDVCVCVCVGWVSKNFPEDYEARPMRLSHSLTRKPDQKQQCLQQATQLQKTKRELNTRYLSAKTLITGEYPLSPLETKSKQCYQ